MPAPKNNQNTVGNGGRASSYRKEYCEQARKLCLLGATDKDLADFFEVSEKTIYNWRVKHVEFLRANKEGKTIADAEVAASLFHRAKGHSHPDTHVSNFHGKITITPLTKHYPADTTAALIWLKNRQPDKWRDNKGIDLSGKDGAPITVSISPLDVKI